MNRVNRLVASGLVLLSVIAPAGAQEAGRYANEAANCKRVADEGRAWIGLMEFNAKEAGDVAAADIAEVRAWFATYIAAWDEAARQFEAGDPEAAGKANTVAGGMVRDADRWRDRIAARQEQAKSAPTEQWVAKERENLPPEAAAQFDAFVEATKAVSDAWGRYAETLSPTATGADVRAARQAINVANGERDIAGARLNWARETHDLYADRATSTALDERLTALEKVEAEIERAKRQRVELDGKLDEAEHARREAVDGVRKAADAARKQREAADRGTN